VLSFVGLRALRAAMFMPFPGMDDNPARVAIQQSLTNMDFTMFVFALALSLLTGILAGMYPAWRIGRLTPSTFLKTQ
jgi:ABC-type lipoprotein release transport system permease subunit